MRNFFRLTGTRTPAGGLRNYLWLDLASFFSGYAPFFQVNRKKSPAGRPGPLSRDRSGGVFFRLRSVFFRLTGTRTPAGQPRQPANVFYVIGVSRAPTGTASGRFFQVNRNKNARGPAPAIISGSIRGRFFYGYGSVFSRLTGEKSEPCWRANYLSTDPASFFQVERFFQVNRRKSFSDHTHPGLAEVTI